MKYTLLIAILLLGVMTSCVPHKDMLYLQDKSTATDSLQLMVERQKPYRVQINDILSIRIKVLDQDNVSIFNPIADEANLNASSRERAYYDGFTVDTHGNIRIPVLGEVNVLGRTTEEIQQLLEQQLLEEQFKETANIFITVKLSGLRYTTLGELGSTGSKVLFQERVNIFEAIANSGDIPVIGDRQHVQIIRQYPQGQEIHEIDLTDKNVMQSPYYYIQPNDMIYVKPLKQKAWGTGTTGREVLTSVVAIISLVTTTLLLINRI